MTTIDDHVLILQVERANEQLEDRVASLEGTDEPDRYDAELTDHAVRIQELNSDLLGLAELVTEITERMAAMERRQARLFEACKRALVD